LEALRQCGASLRVANVRNLRDPHVIGGAVQFLFLHHIVFILQTSLR